MVVGTLGEVVLLGFERDEKRIGVVVAIDGKGAVVVQGDKICQEVIAHKCEVLSHQLAHIADDKPQLHFKPLLLIVGRGLGYLLFSYGSNFADIEIGIIA